MHTSLFSGNTYRLDVMDMPGNVQPGRMSTTCSKIDRPVRIETSPRKVNQTQCVRAALRFAPPDFLPVILLF